jgi:hypothetical protein
MLYTRYLTLVQNEGRTGTKIGTEGACTGLVANICSASILRPLGHSSACRDTCQQWLTPAQAGQTK